MSTHAPLKILHIFPEFRRGGAPVNTLRFITATQGKFQHMAAGRKNDPALFAEFLPYAQCFDIDLSRPSRRSFTELRKYIREQKPDIIHANGKAGSFYGWLLSYGFFPKRRIVLTLRGFHDRFTGLKSKLYRLLERSASRRFGAVICVSPSEKEHYRQLIRPDEKKIVLIPNGIEISRAPLPSEMESAYRQFRINIVSISRISPQKDLVAMVTAFSAAAAEQNDIALHIMGGLSHGEEEYRQQVESAINSSSAADRIFLWGDVKGAGNLIAHFDIYWSTARFEGLPTAVVEAFLSRAPVIATACIGNIDLIRDGETGFLTQLGNVDDMACALKNVMESIASPGMKKITDRAYAEASVYTIENQVKRITDLYRSILKGSVK